MELALKYSHFQSETATLGDSLKTTARRLYADSLVNKAKLKNV